jgi:hypothetical protein
MTGMIVKLRNNAKDFHLMKALFSAGFVSCGCLRLAECS